MIAAGELPARFELRAHLGAGGHGEVFRVRERLAGGEVAVKRLTRLDPASIARFKREFRTLAELRHPNLAALHELAHEEGQWLLVMELVPGTDVASWCGRDPARWRAVLGGLHAGLEALHGAGFLHRDLRSPNVRVTPEGRVVLLDFGLAEPTGRRGEVVASALATAPEQVAGQELGPASDWYAVGVMLYVGLTGSAPFEGLRGPQILAAKLHAPAPAIGLRRPDLPEDLAALVDALLARDPEARLERAEPLLRALAGGGGGAPVRSDAPRFVGRQPELAALSAALDVARAEGGVIHVRVEGPSGIGKSALLRRFVADAREARGFWGRCFEAESVPFAGLDAVVEQIAELRGASSAPDEGDDGLAHDALRALFPVLGRATRREVRDAPDPAETLRRAARGLGLALTRAADGRVPLVVIDDAQWGGEDTARVLARLSPGPLVLVTVVRTDEPSRALVPSLDALRPPRARVRLEPLGAADVGQLARAEGREDGADIHRQTGGLPLFVGEMLRGARGATLPEALRARVSSLPDAERALLLALAVGARPIERGLAYEVVARLGVGHGAGALGGLRAGRFVRVRHDASGSALELSHAAVGDAALAALAGTREEAGRRSLSAVHGCFDDAMEALDLEDPESRARHARAAGRVERARRFLERAAERAQASFAFEHAARLYEELLELGPEEPARIERARGDAWAAAGRGARAAEAFARALGARAPTLDDPEALELARLEAEHLFHAGHVEAGYEVLRRVLAAADLPFVSPRRAIAGVALRLLWLRARGFAPAPRARPASARELARVDLCFAAGVALLNVDSFRAADSLTRSLVLALEAGEPTRLARSLAFFAAHASTGGPRVAPRVRAMLAAVDHLAVETGDPHVADVAVAARSIFAFHNGAYDDALRFARAGEEAFRGRPGTVRERVTAQIYQCASLAMMGAWDELEVERSRLVDDAEARGDRFGITNGCSGLMNAVWLAQGDPARARREAERAIALWSDATFTLQHAFDVIAQARIDLYEDDPERALARLERAKAPLRRALIFRIRFFRVQVLDLVARAHLLRGRGGAAGVARAAHLARAIRDERTSFYAPVADGLDAAVRHARGDLAGARSAAERARDGYQRHGMHAHAALLDRVVGAVSGRTLGLSLGPVRNVERFARALAPVLR